MLMWLLAVPAMRLAPRTAASSSRPTTPPTMHLRDQVGTGLGVFGRVAPATTADPSTTSVQVAGQSLCTWSYQDGAVDQVQVFITSEGRPIDADVELWQGPDNTPVMMRVYTEDGQLRPFSAVIQTPRSPSTVAVRNIGPEAFPFAANVVAYDVDTPNADCLASSAPVQGGDLITYRCEPNVDSVQVLIQTDGRPLNARIELLEGAETNKQAIELYTEDGLDRPFLCFLETPGIGSVVRVINTAPLEFPMWAAVVPHSMDPEELLPIARPTGVPMRYETPYVAPYGASYVAPYVAPYVASYVAPLPRSGPWAPYPLRGQAPYRGYTPSAETLAKERAQVAKENEAAATEAARKAQEEAGRAAQEARRVEEESRRCEEEAQRLEQEATQARQRAADSAQVAATDAWKAYESERAAAKPSYRSPPGRNPSYDQAGRVYGQQSNPGDYRNPYSPRYYGRE